MLKYTNINCTTSIGVAWNRLLIICMTIFQCIRMYRTYYEATIKMFIVEREIYKWMAAAWKWCILIRHRFWIDINRQIASNFQSHFIVHTVQYVPKYLKCILRSMVRSTRQINRHKYTHSERVSIRVMAFAAINLMTAWNVRYVFVLVVGFDFFLFCFSSIRSCYAKNINRFKAWLFSKYCNLTASLMEWTKCTVECVCVCVCGWR